MMAVPYVVRKANHDEASPVHVFLWYDPMFEEPPPQRRMLTMSLSAQPTGRPQVVENTSEASSFFEPGDTNFRFGTGTVIMKFDCHKKFHYLVVS